MYKIALCDDEIKELDKMQSILNAYMEKYDGLEFMIKRFRNAEELLYMIKEEEYVPYLLFMDIFMSGRSGIEAAKEIRELGIECKIIFLTISREYALEAFGVDAVQYLVKPVCDKDIFRILCKFIKEKAEEDRRYLLLRIDGSIRKIAVSDIVYCEAWKKQQCIFMSDGTQVLQSMTMSKIYEMLSGYEKFVKVGVSYIVNLEHVTGINVQEMSMDNGKKIYMPRGAYKTLREQYFNYYCTKME